MRNRIGLVLQISTATLVISGFLALATTPNYGAPLVLAGLVLVFVSAYGERLDAKYRTYRFCTNTITVLTALTLFALLFSNSVLDVVTWLVIYIQCYKLVHRKAARDYYQIFLMAFFMLICGCALEPEPSIGLTLALSLISAVWAFIALQVYVEAEANKANAIAEVYALGTQAPAHTSSNPSLLNAGFVLSVAALCAACIVLASGIFLFTPRMQAGVFGRTNYIPLAEQRTGLSDEVDLARGGRLEPDSSPVMLVEFPDEPEGQYNGPLYWRSATFDQYTGGATWESFGVSGIINDAFPEAGFLSQNAFTVTRTPARPGRVVRQQIYLDRIDGANLPCLPLVRQVKCRDATLAWESRSDFCVAITRKKSSSLRYEALSEVEEPTPEQLRNARQNYQDAFTERDYLLLTNHGLQPRTVELAQQIAQGAANAYDKAGAIQTWLESGALGYTLDLPPLPKDHPVDAFLHETKQGHCQLFASAMALMLRTLGIPARVVSGYRGGEWSDRDRAYTIRNSMAHLWVEVYFIDYGWVTFDPSPPPEPLPGGVYALARMLSRAMLRGKMMWYRDIVGYAGAFNWQQLRDFSLAAITFDGSLLERALTGGGLSTASVPVRILSGGILLAATAILVMLWRTRDRTITPLRKTSLTPDQRRAVYLLRMLKRRLRRHGLAYAGSSAGEILTEVQRTATLPPEPVEHIVGIYNRVRFGGRSLPAQHYKKLRNMVRTLRRERHPHSHNTENLS